MFRHTPQRKSRGQSIVEFALITPLLLTLLFGLIEGGRLIYAYNTVNHAAQEAARVGVLAGTGGVGEVKAKAISAGDPLAINAGDVTVEVNNGSKSFADRDIGDRLSVTVDHDFIPIVVLVFGSTASIHVSGTSELMVE
jgi:Flp pilus assembly protein TadG